MGRHGWGAIVTGAGDTKSDSGWGGLPLFLVEQILEMKHNVQMVFSMFLFFFSPFVCAMKLVKSQLIFM